MRRLEKENRRKDLMYAYSQSAFDEAATKLHNRLKEIRKRVRTHIDHPGSKETVPAKTLLLPAAGTLRKRSSRRVYWKP